MRRPTLGSVIFASFIAPLPASIAAQGAGNSDYPLEALSKHEQGVVLVDLTIGPSGRISKCVVLMDPNSPSLASTTCDMLEKGAHFASARDKLGNPVQSHALAKMTWVIPGCQVPKQDDPRLAGAVSVAVITSLDHC